MAEPDQKPSPRQTGAADPDVIEGPGSVKHEEVYERLRRAIIAGQLEPGGAVSVRSLAAEFGVSAMPAREAIRRLVAVGALEMTPTRRVKVATMTPAKFEELMIARETLEPAIAGLALEKIGSNQRRLDALIAKLQAVDALLDDAIARGDIAAYGKYNSKFHFTLYEAANASVLLSLIESLWLQIGPFMRVVIGRLGTASLVDQHKAAIAALAGKDAERLKDAIRLDIIEGMRSIAGEIAREGS
jgi:DNA-binding GntR family transcriptional regulator